MKNVVMENRTGEWPVWWDVSIWVDGSNDANVTWIRWTRDGNSVNGRLCYGPTDDRREDDFTGVAIGCWPRSGRLEAGRAPYDPGPQYRTVGEVSEVK